MAKLFANSGDNDQKPVCLNTYVMTVHNMLASESCAFYYHFSQSIRTPYSLTILVLFILLPTDISEKLKDEWQTV